MVAPVAPKSLDATRQPSQRQQLEQASQQFEAMFTRMMLKSMRQAQDSLGGGLFDSAASRQFRDMQDDKLATALAGRGTLGLAKAMEEFVARGRPDLAAEETPK